MNGQNTPPHHSKPSRLSTALKRMRGFLTSKLTLGLLGCVLTKFLFDVFLPTEYGQHRQDAKEAAKQAAISKANAHRDEPKIKLSLQEKIRSLLRGFTKLEESINPAETPPNETAAMYMDTIESLNKGGNFEYSNEKPIVLMEKYIKICRASEDLRLKTRICCARTSYIKLRDLVIDLDYARDGDLSKFPDSASIIKRCRDIAAFNYWLRLEVSEAPPTPETFINENIQAFNDFSYWLWVERYTLYALILFISIMIAIKMHRARRATHAIQQTEPVSPALDSTPSHGELCAPRR